MRHCRDDPSAPRRSPRRRWTTRTLLALIAVVPCLGAGARAHASLEPVRQVETAASVNAKAWIGRAEEVERYLRTAAIDRMEEVATGVTKPRRAYFTPGGPIESMAWKVLKPGMHQGFWDSYKAEIAAYQMDKLLGLNMVPPTVERTIGKDTGSAMMWVTPTRMWQMGETDAPKSIDWTRQITRMKMFDDLIGNTDRNAGNLLVDPSWNAILIDHSRGFTSGKDLPSKLSRIDPDLWARMQSLTFDDLTAVLGPWIDKDAVRDILLRRTAMRKVIEELIKAKGESAAVLPPAGRP